MKGKKEAKGGGRGEDLMKGEEEVEQEEEIRLQGDEEKKKRCG